jgi:hypothetical protein
MAERKIEQYKYLGFELCTFENDECEKCGKSVKEIFYRRTSYWNEEGDYWCADCIEKELGECIVAERAAGGRGDE